MYFDYSRQQKFTQVLISLKKLIKERRTIGKTSGMNLMQTPVDPGVLCHDHPYPFCVRIAYNLLPWYVNDLHIRPGSKRAPNWFWKRPTREGLEKWGYGRHINRSD